MACTADFASKRTVFSHVARVLHESEHESGAGGPLPAKGSKTLNTAQACGFPSPSLKCQQLKLFVTLMAE